MSGDPQDLTERERMMTTLTAILSDADGLEAKVVPVDAHTIGIDTGTTRLLLQVGVIDERSIPWQSPHMFRAIADSRFCAHQQPGHPTVCLMLPDHVIHHQR